MKFLHIISIVFLTMGVSGCLGERLIDISGTFYKVDNNKLCLHHKNNLTKGNISAFDSHQLVLNKVNQTTSCAEFSIHNDTITSKSTTNTDVIIQPYTVYSFYTHAYKFDGTGHSADGFGPSMCFTKNQDQEYILHIVNFRETDKPSKLASYCAK